MLAMVTDSVYANAAPGQWPNADRNSGRYSTITSQTATCKNLPPLSDRYRATYTSGGYRERNEGACCHPTQVARTCRPIGKIAAQATKLAI